MGPSIVKEGLEGEAGGIYRFYRRHPSTMSTLCPCNRGVTTFGVSHPRVFGGAGLEGRGGEGRWGEVGIALGGVWGGGARDASHSRRHNTPGPEVWAQPLGGGGSGCQPPAAGGRTSVGGRMQTSPRPRTRADPAPAASGPADSAQLQPSPEPGAGAGAGAGAPGPGAGPGERSAQGLPAGWGLLRPSARSCLGEGLSRPRSPGRPGGRLQGAPPPRWRVRGGLGPLLTRAGRLRLRRRRPDRRLGGPSCGGGPGAAVLE